MNKGYRWKKTLFSEQGRSQLEKLWLAPWASRRWKELLELLDQLDAKIAELTAAVEQEANQRPEVLRLMTHPGVGPVTGLAYVQVLGTPDRFPRGKQIGSYIGLIPCEDSSAGKQRLGHLSKQGNALLRYLLVEAAQAAARSNPHRQPWPGNSRFGCTGCGATVGTIRNWSVSVRTRESSLPDMA